MKRISTIFFFLFFLTTIKALAQDYVLVPENFYLQRGDNLKMHLVNANQFMKQDEIGFDAAKMEKFVLTTGSKKSERMLTHKAGDTIATVQVEKEGLNMVVMSRKPVTDDIDRDDFIKLLDDEALTSFSEKAKNSSKDNFREKYSWNLKTLVEVDKPSGNDFNKPQEQEYEIILKDNPYKGNYGDDIIAAVNFHGKPIVNAVVAFYIKSLGGNVFVQKLSTDKLGQVYFKLTREGIYMLRSLHMEPSKEKGTDYETWMSTFTFAFESTNTMPNTYKEFGFGNKH